jgi:hypothetical protein
MYYSVYKKLKNNVIANLRYNKQSLLGEVGGTLGMFLGLSFLSMSQRMFKAMHQ